MDKVTYRLLGSKIGLRSLNKEDAWGNYYSWLQTPEIVEILTTQKFPTSRENLENYIHNNNNAGVEALFGICHLKTDNLLGTLRLSNFDWISGTASIGIVIGDKNARGKGFAKEALLLCISYAFNTLNLQKIYAGVASNNTPSLALFGSVMQKEGIRRNHVFSEGSLRDEHMFAIFK